MKLTPKGKRVVYDSPGDKFGVYLWKMPTGGYIADEDHNFLSIASEYGDIIKIHRLREAVKSLGIEEGEPVFFPGHRKISDEEWEIQRERQRLGLVPDTEDIGNLVDDYRRGPSDR